MALKAQFQMIMALDLALHVSSAFGFSSVQALAQDLLRFAKSKDFFRRRYKMLCAMYLY